ncbi:MAG: c-type cytochrome [Gammaproteobacteria bacterium]|nr:c-type cytochrome [Gammaproteobacteria bacterium]
MIKKIAICVAFASLSMTMQGALAAGDAAAGKGKSELCQSCHGEQGLSVNPECPNLAGQKPGYIYKQVTDFQKNLRNNDTMSPMAGMVTDMQDLKDIAAYFSSQKSMSQKEGSFGKSSGDKKKVEAGKKLFLEGNSDSGVYGCVNCHGQDGRGKDATNQIFPIIGGQTKDYLVKQLMDLKAGTRTNDPAGMMGDIAKKLSEKEIDEVADYLSAM